MYIYPKNSLPSIIHVYLPILYTHAQFKTIINVLHFTFKPTSSFGLPPFIPKISNQFHMFLCMKPSLSIKNLRVEYLSPEPKHAEMHAFYVCFVNRALFYFIIVLIAVS